MILQDLSTSGTHTRGRLSEHIKRSKWNRSQLVYVILTFDYNRVPLARFISRPLSIQAGRRSALVADTF